MLNTVGKVKKWERVDCKIWLGSECKDICDGKYLYLCQRDLDRTCFSCT